MKKVRFIVITAAVLMGFQHNAKAALPSDTMLIVGNKAYYYEDISIKLNEINNQIFNNPTNIYYSDGSKIVDIYTGSTIPESELVSRIGSIVYYYSGGVTTTYISDSSGEYNKASDNSSAFAAVNVSLTRVMDGLYIVSTKINSITGVTGAAYYSINNTGEDSGTKIIKDTIVTSLQSITSTMPISLYSSDNEIIAYGNITLPKILSGASVTATVNVALNTQSHGDYTSTNKLGQGNRSNTGLITADEDYIYYSNTTDSGKIYKMSDSGLENYIICDDDAKYITASGGWIYYSNYSDNGKIYKVKVDGTRRQKISDNIGTFLNVLGDKIYYSNRSDGGKIYSLDSTGNSVCICSDEADYIGISGGNAIYYSNGSDEGKLYYMALDGSNKKIVPYTQSNVEYINTSDSANVYYSTSDGQVYKVGESYPIVIKLVTTDKNGNSSAPVEDKVSDINISGSNIYYVSLLDGNKIYKVGANGGVGEKITDVSAGDINIYVENVDNVSTRKDIVYFTQSKKLYKVLDPVTSVDKNGNTVYTLKTSAISKLKSSVTIKTVNNIDVSVDDNDAGKGISDIDLDKYLPDKVAATMSDNTIRQLVVNWDRDNYKNKSGVCTFSGTIVGYNKTLTLTLTLASASISSSYIEVNNNIGKNDNVSTLDGAILSDGNKLASGDLLKIYDSSTATKPIAQQSADSNGKVSISGLDLNAKGGTLYITITKAAQSTQGTQAESRRTAVVYGVEVPAAPLGISIDLSNVATQEPSTIDTATDVIVNNFKITSSLGVSFTTLQYRVSTVDSSGIVTQLDWTDLTSDGIINSVKIGKGGSQIQFRTKASGSTPASTPTNVILIDPRGVAPSGINFEEEAVSKTVTIIGTSTNMEYSMGGSWTTCTSGNTVVTSVPENTPIMVRRKATASVLPSIQATQIKITTSTGLYSIGASGGTLTLKSTTPVTWTVSEENGIKGSSTSKAIITPDLSDTTKAALTGSENGRVKVWATAKDGTGLQGYVIITIGAQNTVTVSSDAQLKAALQDTSIATIKLLSRVYNMDYYTVTRPLTIEGTGNMSQIKINSLNSEGSFIKSNTGGLTLNDLTIDGNAKDISKVIDSAGVSLALDGVYISNIKNSSGTCYGIYQKDGSLTVSNSKFDSTNSMNYALYADAAAKAEITNNTFIATNQVFGYQCGYYHNSTGDLTAQGNSFSNYNHYDSTLTSNIIPQIEKTDAAMILTKGGTLTIGGSGKSQPNSFNNCVVSIMKDPAITSINKSNILDNGYNSVSGQVLYNGNLIPTPADYNGTVSGLTAYISSTGTFAKGAVISGGATGAQAGSGTAYLVSSSIPYTSCDSKAELDALANNSTYCTKASFTDASSISINAPAQSGNYNLIVVDSGGNVSQKSTQRITVDADAPAINITEQTVAPGGTITFQSGEVGIAYLIPSSTANSSVDTQNKVNALVASTPAQYTKVSVSTANQNTSITVPSTPGIYNLIAFDNYGNMNRSLAAITADTSKPVVTVNSTSSVGGDEIVSYPEMASGYTVVAQSNKGSGKIYIAPSGTYTTESSLASASIGSASVTAANTNININVAAGKILENNSSYYAYAVDSAGNISAAQLAFKTDTKSPTFTVSGTSVDNAGDTITITFDEKVNTNTLSESIVKGSTVNIAVCDDALGTNAVTITKSNASSAWSSDGKTLTITLDEIKDGGFIPNNKFLRIILPSTVTDSAGNLVSVNPVYSSAAVAFESTKPKVVSVTSNTVVFSEPVDKTTAENASNYIISGSAVDSGQTVTGASLGADKKTVTLTFSSSLNTSSGNNFTVMATWVTDLVGNSIDTNNNSGSTSF